MSTQPPPPPPSSLTPPRPILPPGEVPNSQDSDEGHSPDSEYLLEEVGKAQGRETDTGIETARETETSTGTVTEPSTTTPLPDRLAPSSTNALPSPEPRLREATPFPAPPLPFPSTAAHTLCLPKPPVPSVRPAAHPQSHPPPTPPSPAFPASAPSPASRRLTAQIDSLHSQLRALTSQLAASNALLPDPGLAPAIVKSHIELLHSYNEIKDVGLGLMGLIADGRGVRLGAVMEECGVGERD